MTIQSGETLVFGPPREIAQDENVDPTPARPLQRSMLRGFACRCPQCGKGRIFDGYLATVDNCSVCRLHIDGHRADDLPPYLTVFIVGHIVVALFMTTDAMFILSMWAHLAILVPLTIVMSLALLRPLKGATIGLQWAMHMHGFGEAGAGADH